MVRWRFALVLAMLVAAQVTCSKDDDDDDDEEATTTLNGDDDDDDQEEAPRQPTEPSTTTPRVTRTTGNRLQCYVCSYKQGNSDPDCLDPLHYNVTSAYCPTPGDQCFTAVETRESSVSIVVRGCKTNCLNSPDILCCNTDLCNSKPVGRPSALRAVSTDAATKSLPQTVLYFVTVLLLLQAVVKVNIV